MAIFVANVQVTYAQQRLSARYLNYIDEYKDIAIEQQRRHGIPASITLAQGLLESQAGQSRLATAGNNHFGIKCTGWAGDTIRHDDDELQECFRSYASAAESYNDHSLFLKRKRYEPLYALAITDYKGWAQTLKKCGYATDPKYPEKLINIIETYELFQYDDSRYQALARTVETTEPAAKPAKKVQQMGHDAQLESEVEDMLAAEIGQQHVVRRRRGLYCITAR
ncbi:MAG: glucosaminidase domain-containing protein, partial [bacterium]|nr:glucosaminidase domain-containing protein [bacterium]